MARLASGNESGYFIEKQDLKEAIRQPKTDRSIPDDYYQKKSKLKKIRSQNYKNRCLIT